MRSLSASTINGTSQPSLNFRVIFLLAALEAKESKISWIKSWISNGSISMVKNPDSNWVMASNSSTSVAIRSVLLAAFFKKGTATTGSSMAPSNSVLI